MAKLVLLVVAAAWAAVLIPPMLRSRVENRPNSSVTDFRRQLNKLQSTATPARGSARAMGRPLAQSSSPLQRSAAAGRPGAAPRHRQASMRNGGTATRHRAAPARHDAPESTRFRSHGDPTGGRRRPQHTRVDAHPAQRRPHADRRPAPRSVDPAAMVKRRRMNVLFILVVTAACTMFLAATTSSTVMLYLFALSFLSLCGYVYMLAQIREREAGNWDNGWFESH